MLSPRYPVPAGWSSPQPFSEVSLPLGEQCTRADYTGGRGSCVQRAGLADGGQEAGSCWGSEAHGP